MKKIVIWALTILIGPTGCTPAMVSQPTITYTPSNTPVAAPVITPGTIILSPAKLPTPAPVITPAVNPVIITSNATVITAPVQSQAEEPAAARAMVQVWGSNATGNASKQMLSFGVAVGDGSQVLTFIDFENYTPGAMEIVTRNQARYSVTIQAADTYTGVTLLKINGADRVPAAAVSQPTLPAQGQQVRVWGWLNDAFGYSNIQVVYDTSRPIFFRTEHDYVLGGPYVDYPGALVTDNAGYVLGFETVFRTRLAIPLGSIGRMPPIASIGRGIELLSSNVTNQSWADKPAVFTAANSLNGTGSGMNYYIPAAEYDKMAAAANNLSRTLGEPVPTDDLLFDRNYFRWWQNLDGPILLLVYPKPVDLKSGNGTILAQAKWIGIQWSRRGGLPNRMVYGSNPYAIQGGFTLLGNVTSLQQTILPFP